MSVVNETDIVLTEIRDRAAVITLAVFAFLMRSMQAQIRFQF